MLCLIADEMHASIIPMLQSVGITPDYQPNITRSQILDILPKYQGLIIRSKTFVDREVLARALQLRFIGRAGAGLDTIDVEAVEEKGIQLVHASEGNRDAVGEHAVGMLLCLLNNIHFADRQVRNGIWDREGNRGFEIMDKTVGIVGYGNMGQSFAKRLSGFGCKVIAYDKYKVNYSDAYASEVSMEQIFQEADIVGFHLPLTAETRKMVNAEYLERFKKPVWLINTARGEIIALQDLLNALQNAKVKGAALDVLENEKLNKLTPEQQATLQQLAEGFKVVFTPHVAGWTHESYYKINQVLIEKIKNIIK
jgi:D-3-phosphoglycerate dehydrogenase